jgi:hypothetical protein
MNDEVPLTTLPEYAHAKLLGADFAADFFPDTHAVEMKLMLLDEQWREIQSVCAENEWSLEEGLRILLANGLAYLQHRMQNDSIETKQTILDISAQYSVMKFRTFQFMQAAQTLDMKLNAAQSELKMLRQINEQLRTELQHRAADNCP